MTPLLDYDLTHGEVVDLFFLLKRHKSPGFDQILNEEIISTIVDELEEPQDSPISYQNIELLKFIFQIVSDFWFSESVPGDFKKIILRSFLKKKEKSFNDPPKYWPISLLNALMKVYKGIICRRLNDFLVENRVLSPNQAANRANRSTSDLIFVLHELLSEFIFCILGPAGSL